MRLPWGVLVIGLLCATSAVRAQEDGADTRAVPTDAFNPDVEAKDGSQSHPVRGGVLRQRVPGDPQSLNPMGDNEALTQTIAQYLFDVLAQRDRVTYEWLPHLARWWETRDTLTLTSGETLQGLILDQDAQRVRFAPGAAIVTVAECDLERLELLEPAEGEDPRVPCNQGPAIERALGRRVRLIPRADTDLPRAEGRVERPADGRYTLELTQDPTQVREVPRAEVQVALEGQEGAQEAVPALRRQAAFVFHLRRGVRWHDGQPFTAADVVFSFDTIMNPAADTSSTRQSFRDLTSYRQLDDYAVEFVYGKQYFLAFSAIASLGSIYPRHRFEPWKFGGAKDAAFGKHFQEHPDHRGPVGTGPYRFKRWDQGQVVELERNEDWWASSAPDADGVRHPVVPWIDPAQPYLDALRWVVINDTQAALKSLAKGEVDADFDVEPSTWTEAETNARDFTDAFARAQFLDPTYTFIGWNMHRKGVGPERQFFADRRVRRAMTLLIPRQRILREIHRGLGELAHGHFFRYGPYSDPDVEPLPTSLERARLLLDQAGWIDHDGDGIRDRDGVPFEFEYVIHNMRDYHQKVADIIKEAVERAGVRMQIKKLDWPVFLETITDQKFDAVRLAWGVDSPVDDDPFQCWHSSQATGRGDNYVSFKNPLADRLILAGRREVDFRKRQRIFRRLDRLIADEQPYTFLLHMYTLGFYRRSFRNVRFYRIGTTPYLFTEWYVPLAFQEAR